MAPAVIRRIEHRDSGQGWGKVGHDLKCWDMPCPGVDGGLDAWSSRYAYVDASEWFFGWTAESLERWVDRLDREKLALDGFVLRTYLCHPGTVLIGHEQSVFVRDEAQLLFTESLI